VPPTTPPAPAKPAPPCLVLIDASGFIFRAYHAIPTLSTSKGLPTNAALGFTRMLLKTLRDLEPTHVALAFDRESRLGRQKIDPNYKANRAPPPDDLLPQFDLIRKVVDALNVPILEVAGWEADDVIGTLAERAEDQGFSVLVVTGDKDFVQIVDDHITLFDPMQDRLTGPKEVRERLGIEPAQMRDYLALIGDAVDNVPKVPGIGPKTAMELLKQFGTVEGLLSRLDEVQKPKVREALRENQETLKRAKQLVTFKTDLPIDTDFQKLIRRPTKEEEARALFTELEFYRLLQELPKGAGSVAPATAASDTPSSTSGVAGAASAPAVETPIATLSSLEAFVARAKEAGRLGLAPAFEGGAFAAPLLGLGLALADGERLYVPLGHEGLGVSVLDGGAVDGVLAPLWANAQVEKVGHDLKSAVLLFARRGFSLEALTDVELLSFLLNPSRREHALADLARERLGVELWAPFDAAQAKKSGTGLKDRRPEEVARAFGDRAHAALGLAQALWPELEAAGLTRVARDMELPLIPVLARMEREGIQLDREALAQISRHVDTECQALLEKAQAQAGHAFNVNSNAQLAQVLFEELKLPVQKKLKTGPSTDAEVLEKLAEQHPLPATILEYRALAKLKNTYLDTLGPLAGRDGRIHTSYRQVGAATGRMSSTDPNLQNIPVRTELGREIRKAFVAKEGAMLVSADYSQIELRLLAHIAEDPALIDAFQKDEDVHTRTASEVFGVPAAQVTSDQRRVAKMVNFGIAYGLSPHGLSTRLSIPREEASEIIRRYFERYAGIRRYLEETVARARKTGAVTTLFGRRRLMADLLSKTRALAQAAERAAINMPIQGTAADLVKLAMVEVDRELSKTGMRARMLLQVHDELLFEAPTEEVSAVKSLAQKCMAGVATLKVPLKVDVGAGRSWADAH
jgi:DNA polymerase-1